MCIAAFAFGVSTDYRLVFAANRDELHARPTAPAGWWPEGILGGRDLLAGGSWLGLDRRGRLAAITNLPQLKPREFPRSRGSLVCDFLLGEASAEDFAARFAETSGDYGPCNLLVWDGGDFYYATTGAASEPLAPGLHALGNAPLGADWPRVHRAEQGLAASLEAADPEAALLAMLANGRDAPVTSADAALARRRTEIFIKDARYGTRCSTVILVGNDGRVRFTERSFGADGEPTGEARHAFALGPG